MKPSICASYRNCVDTVQCCTYVEHTYALQRKTLETGTSLMMCQILNDAFLIQTHSKSSDFRAIHILTRWSHFIYLLPDENQPLSDFE